MGAPRRPQVAPYHHLLLSRMFQKRRMDRYSGDLRVTTLGGM